MPMFPHLLFAVGAVSAFLLAATVGIWSRRGFALMLIGILLSWVPDWKDGREWIGILGIVYAITLRFSGCPCNWDSDPERRGCERHATSETSPCEADESPARYTWIGDLSAERIGKTWRAEDHETLVRAMKRVDELAIGLVAYATRKAKETALKECEQEDRNGARTKTESVGLETQSRSN